MKINAIVARAKDYTIGINGELPWHIPEDFAWFKSNTMDHALVMGRNTFEEIKVPLNGRVNVVLTTNKDKFLEDNEHLVRYLNEPVKDGLEKGRKSLYICEDIDSVNVLLKDLGFNEYFVIGGTKLYTQLIDDISKFFVTEVDMSFPNVDNISKFDYKFNSVEWHLDYCEKLTTNDCKLTFNIYKRKITQ